MNAVEIITKVRDQSEDVADLARALSLSAHVDVGLVRALRGELFERADVTLETALWTSPLVQSRSGTELTLRADVIRQFWKELGQNSDELDRAWSALERSRAPGKPLRRLEEELIRFAIQGHIAEIEQRLSSVINAMRESPQRRRDLSAWSARVLARLPEVARDCEAAKILGSVAAGWVATPKAVASLMPMPENVRLVHRLLGDDKLVDIAIRRVGDFLEVAATFPPPSVTLKIPAANPVLIIDEDTTHRVDPRGLTRIPVKHSQVMIGTADGRRWVLEPERPKPNAAAVGAVWTTGGLAGAYLIGSRHVVTSALNAQPGTKPVQVHFGDSVVHARVVSLDLDADIALLELVFPLTIPPLKLLTEVHQGDPCQMIGPPSPNPSVGDGERLRWTGTVATGWPNVTIRLGDGVPRGLLKSGLPVFVGDKVIGHLRSYAGDELHATSARLIEWWLSHVEALEGKRPTSEVSVYPTGRTWIQSRIEDEAPDSLELEQSHPAVSDDFVLLFGSGPGKKRPAALYRLMNVYPRPAVHTAHLLVRFPQLDEQLVRELNAEIEPLANAPENVDTRALGIHHLLVALVLKIGRASEYGQEQVLRCLDATRGERDLLRHAPLVVQLPEKISTAGLFGTELIREGSIECFRAHRWGTHEVTLVTGDDLRHPPNALRVKVSCINATYGPALRVVPRPSRANELFVAACWQASSSFASVSSSQGMIASDFDLEIVAQCLPGMTSAFACRAAVMFLVDVLAAMDAFGPQHSTYFQVPGIGGRDLFESQSRGELNDGLLTLVWVDPETDIAKVNLAEGTDPGLAFVPSDKTINLELTVDAHEDPVAGRFGVSASRNGRRISGDLASDSVAVSVQALDDRPVKGYVTFHYAVHDGKRLEPTSQRIRASQGVARCTIRRRSEGSAVGAIIEDEGVILELHVPAVSEKVARARAEGARS
jgi:hypothetical protein